MIDEKDMRIKVTREEFEELCKDLFDKVALPAQRALDASGLTIDLIEQVYYTYYMIYILLLCLLNYIYR